MKSIDEFLSRLTNVRKTEKGWQASCPAHDDKKPSLSIAQAEDGRVLLYCFAGCSIEAIVSAMGLKMQDLFLDGSKEAKPTRASSAKLVATYDYTDENGNLLYQVRRYEPKDFRQRRPDGKGGWIYNLDGVKRVPYRLPDILHELLPAEAVFIVEGEKDVHTIKSLGGIATTFAGGANGWREEYKECFKGLYVGIIPDNDEPGRKFAETTAKSLYGTAQSVKIMPLPGLPEKGDVTDWVNQGHTYTQLVDIYRRTPEYKPEPDEKPDEKLEEEDPNIINKDYAHATVLAKLWQGKYRWATHRDCWMVYKDGVWLPESDEVVVKEASDTLRKEYAARLMAPNPGDDITLLTKRIEEANTTARIEGALTFLKGWDGIHTKPEQWDAEKYLLNFKNGTLDLRRGDGFPSFRPHSPDDLLTKQVNANYDPKAYAPKWNAHIERFLPNPNIRRQVQRDLGVSLVGAVLTETLPIWYGTGGNGKSTTVSVIMKLLGDYACKAAPDLLAQSKWDRHPTEVADLCGRRVAFSVEMDRLKHLDEARVKDLTGGDRKKARFSHQDFFEFEQTFSLFLIVNQKPIVTGTDWGIWRRLRLVPWEYTIPDSERRDQDTVIAELLTEADGIMNWLIDGLADYYNDLYWMADEVKALTEEYRAEMDILGEFIADRCELNPRYSVAKGKLYAAYEEWCGGNGEKKVCKKTFTNMLRDRGIRESRSKSSRFYCGIRLKDSNDNWSDASENRNSELENDVVTDDDRFSVNPIEIFVSREFTENVSPPVTHDNSELENEPETNVSNPTTDDDPDILEDDDPFSPDNPGDNNLVSKFSTAKLDSTYPETLTITDGEKPLDVYLRTRPKQVEPRRCLRCEGNGFRWEEMAYNGNGDWICTNCGYTYFRALIEKRPVEG